MISALNTREYYYTFRCSTAKEVWDTLIKIYEIPTKMKR